MGVLEEIVKNAVKLGSIVDLVKHLARLHPLIAHYVKVNLGMTTSIADQKNYVTIESLYKDT